MTILIKNGTLINSNEKKRSDIFIEDGKISKISENINLCSDHIIDAEGCFVFAGFIDTHTHLDLDLAVTTTADNFETGTKAAVLGGTTTVLDFATQDKGMSLEDALKKWHCKADGNSNCNYGFHMAVSEWNDKIKSEIDTMIREGITSFKMYMVYPAMRVNNGQIYDAIKFLESKDCIVGVHCEEYDLLNAKIDELHNQGRYDAMAHSLSRPDIVEAAGVSSLMYTAELANAPAWIVHLSCEESLKVAKAARKRGIEVYIETCPQYMILDESQYAEEDGFKYIMSPPLRHKNDREAILRAMNENVIDFIGTDHCSFTMEQKALGNGDFAKVPNGGAGIQNRAELVYTYGVNNGYISLEQMSALLSENASKIFGMYPEKGCLKEGSDADIVVFDPNYPHIISYKTNSHNCDNSPYEGVQVDGKVRDVLVNGEIVVENYSFIKQHCGKYVYRKKSQRTRK